MSWKEIIGNTVIVFAGLIFTLQFALIWVFGEVALYEHIKPILAVETALAVLIVVLGIERFIDDLKRWRENV